MVPVQIFGQFLLMLAVQDLKLKYYDLMIQHALHNDSYLDAAKYYEEVWQTPSIKEDVNGKGRMVSTHDLIIHLRLIIF